MAKIIVSLNGVVLQERKLGTARLTIGRHGKNDIAIDNRAISGEHAVLALAAGEWSIEDLNSTNGTLVNGQPIKKHFLQDRDVVELAKYRLQFVTETAPPPSVVSNAAAGRANKRDLETDVQSAVAVTPPPQLPLATISLLSGPNAGKQLSLLKPIMTIGHPGSQIGVITRRSDGYYLTHVEGEPHLLLNGVALGSEPQLLADGDVIDISGTRIAFSLAKN